MGIEIYVQEDGLKRKANPSEIAQFEQDRLRAEQAQADQESRVASRQSALAKLASLGLTEEEIAAL
jgi:DNA-binding NarL/FixJ family response regulator